ncbi:MAG: hypothetical protein LRY71_01980 [Bacillaceae bacterium]|nr:hypothetical protein [Bacillaceae bacterium]
MLRVFVTLPFLILFICVVVVLWKKVNLLKSIRYTWFISAYCGILFIPLIIYPFLSTDQMLSGEMFRNVETWDNYEESEFYKILEQGSNSELEPFVQKEWVFEIDGTEELIVNENFNGSVFFESRPNLRGEIHVIHYTGKNMMYGIDVSQFTQSPNVKLNGNNLNISFIEKPQILEYVLFEKEFILSQFVDSSNEIFNGRYVEEQAIIVYFPSSITSIVHGNED